MNDCLLYTSDAADDSLRAKQKLGEYLKKNGYE